MPIQQLHLKQNSKTTTNNKLPTPTFNLSLAIRLVFNLSLAIRLVFNLSLAIRLVFSQLVFAATAMGHNIQKEPIGPNPDIKLHHK